MIQVTDSVITTQDYKGVPAGTVFHVEEVSCKFCMGYWNSMMGTYYIAIPLDLCEVNEQ
jgi:hypothetical protein